MLAVCNANNDEKQGEMESFTMGQDQFPDFSNDNLLDSIDFGDLFAGINDGDMLPDLELDPEILANFSSSGESDMNISWSVDKVDEKKDDKKVVLTGSDISVNNSNSVGKEDEIVSKREEPVVTSNQKPKEAEKGRKSSSQSKNPQGKRKVKVDWTPELHRRFVQAVEQLGVDKAVPSRILELMGIDCLTRHNVASHLQKYRSHRKHLLAREAEAASWNQRRQIYGGIGAAGKRDISPWLAQPTMGFPPVTHPPMHHFRPLHVWGHPTVDQSLMHMWPKHLPYSPSPPPQAAAPTWPPIAAAPLPPPPPADPSFWHPHNQRVANSLTPVTPCFPQPLAAQTRFAAPPVPAIPPHAMYKVDPGIGVSNGQPAPRPLIEPHPSKESIDAAIGDVLSKPWLPLPIGLKPPAVDSVLVELQRQGVCKVPPSRA